MMSEAPETNLVSECTTTSAPQSMGDSTMGVKVLSTTSWAPCNGGREDSDILHFTAVQLSHCIPLKGRESS